MIAQYCAYVNIYATISMMDNPEKLLAQQLTAATELHANLDRAYVERCLGKEVIQQLASDAAEEIHLAGAMGGLSDDLDEEASDSLRGEVTTPEPTESIRRHELLHLVERAFLDHATELFGKVEGYGLSNILPDWIIISTESKESGSDFMQLIIRSAESGLLVHKLRWPADGAPVAEPSTLADREIAIAAIQKLAEVNRSLRDDPPDCPDLD